MLISFSFSKSPSPTCTVSFQIQISNSKEFTNESSEKDLGFSYTAVSITQRFNGFNDKFENKLNYE